ncbi:hypothetical protein ACFLQI_02125 [Candidatus Undinarchaeota archaeon]
MMDAMKSEKIQRVIFAGVVLIILLLAAQFFSVIEDYGGTPTGFGTTPPPEPGIEWYLTPIGLYPVNDTNIIDTTPLFNWTKESGTYSDDVVRYHLEIYNDSEMTQLVHNITRFQSIPYDEDSFTEGTGNLWLDDNEVAGADSTTNVTKGTYSVYYATSGNGDGFIYPNSTVIIPEWNLTNQDALIVSLLTNDSITIEYIYFTAEDTPSLVEGNWNWDNWWTCDSNSYNIPAGVWTTLEINFTDCYDDGSAPDSGWENISSINIYDTGIGDPYDIWIDNVYFRGDYTRAMQYQLTSDQALEPDVTYYWRAAGLNEEGTAGSEWSENYSFHVRTPRPILNSLSYSPSEIYRETNVTILSNYTNDTYAIDTILIEHNATGSFVNYTATEVEILASELDVGEVVGYRTYANDTQGEWNISALQTFTVMNGLPEIELLTLTNQDTVSTNTPSFTWSTSDRENDTIVQTILISTSTDFSSPVVNVTYYKIPVDRDAWTEDSTDWNYTSASGETIEGESAVGDHYLKFTYLGSFGDGIAYYPIEKNAGWDLTEYDVFNWMGGTQEYGACVFGDVAYFAFFDAYGTGLWSQAYTCAFPGCYVMPGNLPNCPNGIWQEQSLNLETDLYPDPGFDWTNITHMELVKHGTELISSFDGIFFGKYIENEYTLLSLESLEDGTYYWKVIGNDGYDIGESSVYTFTVQTTLPSDDSDDTTIQTSIPGVLPTSPPPEEAPPAEESSVDTTSGKLPIWTSSKLESIGVILTVEVGPDNEINAFVTDKDSNPLGNVEVAIITETGDVVMVRTNKDGKATIQDSAGDVLSVNVEIDGVVIATQQIPASEASEDAKLGDDVVAAEMGEASNWLMFLVIAIILIPVAMFLGFSKKLD